MKIKEADVVRSLENLDDLCLTPFFARRKTDMADRQAAMDKLTGVYRLQAREDLDEVVLRSYCIASAGM